MTLYEPDVEILSNSVFEKNYSSFKACQEVDHKTDGDFIFFIFFFSLTLLLNPISDSLAFFEENFASWDYQHQLITNLSRRSRSFSSQLASDPIFSSLLHPHLLPPLVPSRTPFFPTVQKRHESCEEGETGNHTEKPGGIHRLSYGVPENVTPQQAVLIVVFCLDRLLVEWEGVRRGRERVWCRKEGRDGMVGMREEKEEEEEEEDWQEGWGMGEWQRWFGDEEALYEEKKVRQEEWEKEKVKMREREKDLSGLLFSFISVCFFYLLPHLSSSDGSEGDRHDTNNHNDNTNNDKNNTKDNNTNDNAGDLSFLLYLYVFSVATKLWTKRGEKEKRNRKNEEEEEKSRFRKKKKKEKEWEGEKGVWGVVGRGFLDASMSFLRGLPTSLPPLSLFPPPTPPFSPFSSPDSFATCLSPLVCPSVPLSPSTISLSEELALLKREKQRLEKEKETRTREDTEEDPRSLPPFHWSEDLGTGGKKGGKGGKGELEPGLYLLQGKVRETMEEEYEKRSFVLQILPSGVFFFFFFFFLNYY